uniref:APN7 n=1 Tax=Helicoverpa armigera TaxID=29058 RepID=A0A6H0D4M9_HELAM|nr:APN7 [Helicoverpa armigera]
MSAMFRAFLIFVCLFSFTKGQSVIVVDEECLNYTVYPVQYELSIYPYIYADHSYYDCELIITVIANAPNVNVIDLDAKDLEIQGESIKVFDGPNNIVNGPRPFEYNDLTSKLRIYLKEPLKMYSKGNRQLYNIKIMFRKFVKEDDSGIFLVKYYDEQSKEYKYLLQTRLSPNKAKYFFPCFENPKFEAVFKFRVFILKDMKDLQYTNTSIVIAEELLTHSIKDGYTIIEYMASPQVGLHQVGFHYSVFANTQLQAKHTNDTIILWAPIDELHDYKFIHNFGITIIDLIHEYAKDDRALVQGPINLITVPDLISGYEIGSWNLLTNGAYRIVNIAQFTSIKQLEAMTFELAQHLSRIWLGNPGEIERTRWKEEWFKEGMATYLAYHFLTQYNYGNPLPEMRPLTVYGLQMKHKAMAVDWHKSTPALETFNRSLAIEIPARYKDLVMMKTGAILWMLENWVESEKFHKSIMNYMKSRRGKYVSLEDFTTTLDHDTIECFHQFFNGSTASRILGSWFRRRGYPVINVQVLRDRTPNSVQLKQRQFSFTLENREVTDFLIPISYVVQNNQDCYNCYKPRFTIGAQTYTFSENLKDGWIIVNRQGTGYYRVNYDAVTWTLIAKSLIENNAIIDELNRAQIVNDVFALYVAGDMNMDLAMDVLEYLEKERSPAVWAAAAAGYELLSTEGANCNMSKQVYWEWESFMRKKVIPMYSQLIKSKDNQWLTRLFRKNVLDLACSLNYEHCHSHVRRIYVEDRRGKHNLFPDCRMSYFFVLGNETFSNTYSRELNPIEEYDKMIADKKIRERLRFISRIPMGEPRPLPIVMSSTTEQTSTEEVTEEQQTDGALSLKYSSMVLLITIIINYLSLR